jgi:hypothetical protein
LNIGTLAASAEPVAKPLPYTAKILPGGVPPATLLVALINDGQARVDKSRVRFAMSTPKFAPSADVTVKLRVQLDPDGSVTVALPRHAAVTEYWPVIVSDEGDSWLPPTSCR